MEDRLRKFAHLVDAGNFTSAARNMHISQPALSMAIHKLERELRAQLYVRGSQPLALTAAGELAYNSAKELSASLRSMQVRLAEVMKQEVAMSIGVIDSMADIMLANRRVVRALETQSKVSLVINNSRYLLESLKRGDIDVAIIAEQSRLLDSSLHTESIGAEPLVTVMHRDIAKQIHHEYAVKEMNTFISYDQPSHTHAMIERFFAIRDITLTPQFYSSSPDVIFHLVRAKKGAAALPYRKVQKQLKSGVLVPIDRRLVIPRRICVVTRRNYQVPHMVHDITESLNLDLAALLAQASN